MNVRTGRIAGVDDCVLWRIGFTGELSYELHVPAAYGLHVWEALQEHGRDLGVRPFGVEAQRILRLEKGHLIVGQDTDGLTKAYSAGLDWAIKLDKADFVGKPELVWQQETGSGPRLVGLQPVAASVVPPEASQIVADDGERTRILGRVTSSRMSPTLHRADLPGPDRRRARRPGHRGHGEAAGRAADRRPGHRPPRPCRPRGAAAARRDDAPVGPVRETGTPVARSPITSPDAAFGGAAPLTLTDLSGMAKVHVRAQHDGAVAVTLGPFGRAARDAAGALVVGSGPGEWLVLDAPGTEGALLARLEELAGSPDEFTSVVDLTHGRALVRLRGERSADLLAKVCAIDLSDDVIPDGAAFRSSVAKLVTDVVRDDIEGERSYLLHCERSSGQYLATALLDAGAELGAQMTTSDPTGA